VDPFVAKIELATFAETWCGAVPSDSVYRSGPAKVEQLAARMMSAFVRSCRRLTDEVNILKQELAGAKTL
jgi:hypothetical protein